MQEWNGFFVLFLFLNKKKTTIPRIKTDTKQKLFNFLVLNLFKLKMALRKWEKFFHFPKGSFLEEEESDIFIILKSESLFISLKKSIILIKLLLFFFALTI